MCSRPRAPRGSPTTRTTPATPSIPPLREALAAKLRAVNGIDVDLEQVWVTTGGTQALSSAVAHPRPGDEVLVPDPGYTTFQMAPRCLAAAVGYSLEPDRDFLPDLAELAALVTADAGDHRQLAVEPPWRGLPRGGAERPARFRVRHDLWLISDEVYEAFTWGVPHVSPASFDTEQRVLTVHSFSKTYALTSTAGSAASSCRPGSATCCARTRRRSSPA